MRESWPRLYTRLCSKQTGEVWIVIFESGNDVILINEAETKRRHVSKASIAGYYSEPDAELLSRREKENG